MITKYIEKHIKRKIYMLNFFLEHMGTQCSLENLINQLNVSRPTFYKDLSNIQEILGDDLEISLCKNNLVFIGNTNVEHSVCLKKIYQQSDFLQILGFFTVKDSKKTFKKFIDESFYSRAKAYTEKKKVEQYFRECGADNNDLKKVLLIAKLETEFGIECLPQYFKKIYMDEIKKIVNKSYFLSFQEKDMFIIIIMCCMKFDDLEISIKNNYFIMSLVNIPNEDLPIFTDLEKLWKFKIPKKRELVCLFYKIISTNIFFPPYIVNNNSWQTDEKIQSLLSLMEKAFGPILVNDLQFLGVFFNCIKLICFEVTDFLLKKDVENINQDFYYTLLNIFIFWEESYEDLTFKINTECIRYFCNKMSVFLKKEEKLKIYIYSETCLEYVEILQSLKIFLKVDVELVDFWLYSPKQFSMIKGKNKLIIADVKYRSTLFKITENIYFFKFPLADFEGDQLNIKLLKLAAR